MSSRKLAFSGMCLALAVVTGLIKVYTMPFGGEVTLCSMLFIMLPGWLFGFGYGAITGLLYGIINFMLFPYFMNVPQFLFDYIFAFSVMSVSCIFKDSKNGLIKGYILSVILRWIMASVAGLIWVSLGYSAWDGWSPLPYSMAYNGAYIFAEAILTVVVLSVPTVRKCFEKVRELANK